MVNVCAFIKKYPLSLSVILLLSYLSLGKCSSSVPMFPGMDKIAHFLMYSFLCIVIWYEYYKSHKTTDRARIFWGAIVAPILFSGMLELFQEFLTIYRTGDVIDFIFNVAGVVFAAFFGRWVIKPLVFRGKT